MNLLTTQKIQELLESAFNNNVDQKPVKITVKEKGVKKTVIKDVLLSDLRKTYLTPCQLIINEILTIQRRIHRDDQYVNLSKSQLERYLTSRTRTTCIFILEHTLGIIEVNHKYRFNDKGGFSNYTKAYIIADEFKGNTFNINVDGDTVPSNSMTRRHRTVVTDTTKGTPYSYIKDNNKNPYSGVPAVCETTGRIYNEFNMMKKEQRQLLTDNNGDSLVDVDLSTSNLQMLIKGIKVDLRDGTYEPMFGFNGKDYLIQEVLQFKADVLNNDFYSLMATEYEIRNNIKYTRDQSKTNVLCWLNGSFSSRKFIQFLRKKYEQITHYIDHVNKTESAGYKTITKKSFRMTVKKKNGMAVKLMKIEATLVNDIYNTLTTLHPSITLYSIFDGFLVDQEHKDLLVKMVEQKGKEYLGFSPKIKVCASCPDEVEVPVIGITTDNGFDITSLPTTVDDLNSYFIPAMIAA